MYRSTGVCRIDKIGIPDDFPAAAKDVLYYHLTPIRGAGTIYIPVDTKVFMRPVISKEQALELIASIPSIEESPNFSKDQKALAEHYKSLLQTHDCATLVQLIKNINKKPAFSMKKGKQREKTDTQYRKQAEELLRGRIIHSAGNSTGKSVRLYQAAVKIKRRINALSLFLFMYSQFILNRHGKTALYPLPWRFLFAVLKDNLKDAPRTCSRWP